MARLDPSLPSPPRAPRPDVVIVGATVRACAESASRAGWTVHAADLFGDVDLRRAARSVVQLSRGKSCGSHVSGAAAPDYPAAIPEVITAFPPAPCVYTGALENHPDVLEAIARHRPLAGNAAAIVRAVRDPRRLAAAARAAGASFPETRASAADVPGDGSFLVKPVASAGGRGIGRWFGDGPPSPNQRPTRWQRFVAGKSLSATFVADGRTSRLLAASMQLNGRRWCGGRAFAYCGSVDRPLDQLGDRLRARLQTLGEMLVTRFGLMGLFGVDLVLDDRRELHVIEVNPRPTASMELHERAGGVSLLRLHLAACGFIAPGPPDRRPTTSTVWSKAIAFAGRRGDTVAPRADALEEHAAAWSAADGMPAIADIPCPGQPLPAGGPLVTVFARGDTMASSLATLRHRVADVRRLFAESAAADSVSRRAAAARPRRPQPRGNTA
jgi:predicted ATP-grasp superfamily ATP-dependent carboligase